MIYTITFNPALDYVIQVDHFKAGQINRNKTENVWLNRYIGDMLIYSTLMMSI